MSIAVKKRGISRHNVPRQMRWPAGNEVEWRERPYSCVTGIRSSFQLPVKTVRVAEANFGCENIRGWDDEKGFGGARGHL